MKKSIAGLLSLAFAFAPVAAADDSKRASHCGRVTATIGAHYSEAFDRLAAERVGKDNFSAAMINQMRARLGASPIDEYADVWVRHFKAVGDQMPRLLIEGYIQYQCETGRLDADIESVSDALDAHCWDEAKEASQALFDAASEQLETAAIERRGRAKILRCVRGALED